MTTFLIILFLTWPIGIIANFLLFYFYFRKFNKGKNLGQLCEEFMFHNKKIGGLFSLPGFNIVIAFILFLIWLGICVSYITDDVKGKLSRRMKRIKNKISNIKINL